MSYESFHIRQYYKHLRVHSIVHIYYALLFQSLSFSKPSKIIVFFFHYSLYLCDQLFTSRHRSKQFPVVYPKHFLLGQCTDTLPRDLLSRSINLRNSLYNESNIYYTRRVLLDHTKYISFGFY